MPIAVLEGAILAGADGISTERDGSTVSSGVDQCSPFSVCAIVDQSHPEDGRTRGPDEFHDGEGCKCENVNATSPILIFF